MAYYPYSAAKTLKYKVGSTTYSVPFFAKKSTALGEYNQSPYLCIKVNGATYYAAMYKKRGGASKIKIKYNGTTYTVASDSYYYYDTSD